MTEDPFLVRNRRNGLKIIPYVGCKSGFDHIFDSLVPGDFGTRIYDVFGGGGGFSLYASARFGSRNVTYNDHNPVVSNLINTLKSDPDGLWEEYQVHAAKSDAVYYNRVRDMDLLEDGLKGAGRFFYLAKNAFSGKIRFNSHNRFNTPMRKNTKCPRVKLERLRYLSSIISELTITTLDFANGYDRVKDGFVYLDPPYMNNTNGHYNAVVTPESFVSFVKNIQGSNKVMISEHSTPEMLGLSNFYTYRVQLRRSLQYITRNTSSEVIAINYDASAVPRNNAA